MCEHCGDETIHHIKGQRSIDREHCFCRCHDTIGSDGYPRSGAPRDDEQGAITACEACRWAHVVAFSTKDWRNDERNMRKAFARDTDA